MLTFELNKSINKKVNDSVKEYLTKDGKTEIRKQIDAAMKQKDEVNRQKRSTKQAQSEKVNGIFGKVILNNVQATHTNESMLQSMKNKINYGVNPDTVSQNNGSINYKGY